MKHVFAGIIVPCSAIIPIVIAVIRRRHLDTKCWYVFVYLCFSLAANIAARIMADNGIRNMPLLHADTIVEMFLFSGFFMYAFPGRKIKMSIRVLAVLFPLFCLINFTFFQSIYQFNTYTRPVEAIIFIVLSLLYWWQPSKPEDDERQWASVPENWFVSGILLYFSSALFPFVFSNHLLDQHSKQANIVVWNLHGAIVIFMYLLFSIAFFKCKK